jgi:hypothetical protein
MSIKSFNQFITEVAETKSVKNDDKGKMFELLLAKHLHPKNTLPEHHRSYSKNPLHSGTAEQVHDKLKERMPPAAYAELNRHAQQSAEEFKKSFPHKITNVHWSSNADTIDKAGDHEKTTGVKDLNANADLILSHAKGFHGISAKYGGGKPNLKNPGLKDLEHHSGMHGTLLKMFDAHKSNMEKMGYAGSLKARHTNWKADATENPEKHKSAEEAAHAMRTQFAQMHGNAMSKKSDAELRDFVRHHAAPKTHIPHTMIHAKVNNKTGDAKPVIYDPPEHVEQHLSKFKNLTARAGSGTVSYIYGTHPETGKEKPVGSMTFKGVSGPHKGEAGMFKL